RQFRETPLASTSNSYDWLPRLDGSSRLDSITDPRSCYNRRSFPPTSFVRLVNEFHSTFLDPGHRHRVRAGLDHLVATKCVSRADLGGHDRQPARAGSGGRTDDPRG